MIKLYNVELLKTDSTPANFTPLNSPTSLSQTFKKRKKPKPTFLFFPDII